MEKVIALGFDFGLKRIGMAVGQSITGTASPLATMQVSHGKIEWKYCDQVINQWQPTVLVLGLPVAERETDVVLNDQVLAFKTALENRYQLPVVLVDERFTTRAARQYLKDKQGGKSAQHLKVDGIAACLIVESFFS